MKKIKGNVCVVVVTYGDEKRWPALDKELRVLVEFKEVQNIIIIDNGSKYSVVEKVSQMPNNKKINVKTNKNNKGSAGGYNDGLICASKSNADFVLLLDDDNLPTESLFSNLNNTTFWQEANEMTAIAFYRKEMHEYMFERDYDLNIKYYLNSFWGFSFLNRINRKRGRQKRENNKFSKVVFSQYSGLFFSKKILEIIGFPDSKYYLYADDTDFTYRMTQAGVSIFTFEDGEIVDLDYSWAYKMKMPMYKAVFYTNSLFRPLYQIRNRVYFDNHFFKTNKFIYSLNKFIWLLAMFLIYMPKSKDGLKRFSKIRYAIKQGLVGNLGQDEKLR